jgi:hypothetical protein
MGSVTRERSSIAWSCCRRGQLSGDGTTRARESRESRPEGRSLPAAAGGRPCTAGAEPELSSGRHDQLPSAPRHEAREPLSAVPWRGRARFESERRPVHDRGPNGAPLVEQEPFRDAVRRLALLDVRPAVRLHRPPMPRPGLCRLEQVRPDRIPEAGSRARHGQDPRRAGDDRGDPRGGGPRRERRARARRRGRRGRRTACRAGGGHALGEEEDGPISRRPRFPRRPPRRAPPRSRRARSRGRSRRRRGRTRRTTGRRRG